MEKMVGKVHNQTFGVLSMVPGCEYYKGYGYGV
jgi:hypothetical protein